MQRLIDRLMGSDVHEPEPDDATSLVVADDSLSQHRRTARLLKPMDYTESIPTNPLREQQRGRLHALLRWLNGPSTPSP